MTVIETQEGTQIYPSVSGIPAGLQHHWKDIGPVTVPTPSRKKIRARAWVCLKCFKYRYTGLPGFRRPPSFRHSTLVAHSELCTPD